MADWLDRVARWSARSEKGPNEAAARRMEVALGRQVSRRGVLQAAALATVGGAAAGKVAADALAGTSGVCEQSSLDRCLDKVALKTDISGMLCRFEKPATRDACRQQMQADRATQAKTCLTTYCSCPDGQEACAASGVPGVCCPAGQICQIDANGASCVDPAAAGGRPARPVPCESDPITADSLFAASSALAGGADEAALSPGGCMRYKRVRNGADVVSEQITAGGALVSDFSYSAGGATGRQDADADGFFEWQGTLTRGSNPDVGVEIVEYDPFTQQPYRRTTRAQRGSVVHNVWQLNQGAGLETIREFDTTVNAEDDRTLARPLVPAQGNAGPHPEFGWFDCDDDTQKKLSSALESCMKKVLPCLDNNKAPGLKNEMAKIFAGKTKFTCGGSGAMAYLNDSTAHPLTTDTEVVINEGRLGQVGPDALLCHELMHATSLGVHDPDLTEIPQDFDDSELDRVKSCTTLCFYPAFTNQCHCATCLSTDVCDERCKPYKKCTNCEKGVCPCESGKRYYASLSACKAKCPTSSTTGNGLRCFAQQCQTLSVCCKK